MTPPSLLTLTTPPFGGPEGVVGGSFRTIPVAHGKAEERCRTGHVDQIWKIGGHPTAGETPRRAVSVHEPPPSVVRAVMSSPTATHVDADGHETALAPNAGLKVAVACQFWGAPAADSEDSGRANPEVSAVDATMTVSAWRMQRLFR